MRNNRIYLDFDDVLCESFVALDAFAREAFGRGAVPGRQVHFDLRQSLGIPDDEYGRFMDRFHAERLEGIPEMPGAAAVLRGWLRDGVAEPVVVTGRPYSAHVASVAWLEARGLGDLEVLHVDKYARFASADGTVPFEALREMGFALAIDDAPAALDALSRAAFCQLGVFERPWNAGWLPPAGAAASLGAPVRFSDWRQVDAFVRALSASEPSSFAEPSFSHNEKQHENP